MSFAEAWIGAESRALAYFAEKLDSDDFTQKRIEDFPRTFPSETDVHIYTIEITGPGEMTPVQAGRSFCSMRMDARIFALFFKRESAQRFAGLAMDAMPYADIANGITHLEHTANPTLFRDVAYLANEQSHGGEIRVWNLSIPLTIVFTAAAAETE